MPRPDGSEDQPRPIYCAACEDRYGRAFPVELYVMLFDRKIGARCCNCRKTVLPWTDQQDLIGVLKLSLAEQPDEPKKPPTSTDETEYLN